MATLQLDVPRLVSGNMENATLLIKNGQSWIAGQFLNTDGANGLVVCAAGDGSGGGGIKYYAYSAQSDPANATTTTTVGRVTADQVWEANIASDDVSADAMVGVRYAITVETGKVTINLDDTTNVGCIVEDLKTNRDPISSTVGDTSDIIRIKFLSIATEAAAG